MINPDQQNNQQPTFDPQMYAMQQQAPHLFPAQQQQPQQQFYPMMTPPEMAPPINGQYPPQQQFQAYQQQPYMSMNPSQQIPSQQFVQYPYPQQQIMADREANQKRRSSTLSNLSKNKNVLDPKQPKRKQNWFLPIVDMSVGFSVCILCTNIVVAPIGTLVMACNDKKSGFNTYVFTIGILQLVLAYASNATGLRYIPLIGLVYWLWAMATCINNICYNVKRENQLRKDKFDRQDNQQALINNKLPKCSKGHAMKKGKGIPKEYIKQRMNNVECDKCGAQGINRQLYFYHCKPCGADLCMQCGNK